MSKIFKKGGSSFAKRLADNLKNTSRSVYDLMGGKKQDSAPRLSEETEDSNELSMGRATSNELLFGDSIEDLDQVELDHFEVSLGDNWSQFEMNLQLEAVQKTITRWADIRKNL